jgi:hypothetical protein
MRRCSADRPQVLRPVTQIGGATGCRSMLSLFPPENATGNYVKVVQRIPVRIDFTNLAAGETATRALRPAISCRHAGNGARAWSTKVASGGNAPSHLGSNFGGWSGRGAAWWAVAKMSLEAELRSVSGVFSAAATAKAAVMPGTISKGIPASRERGDLFAGAAEDERVAGLEADDGAAGAGVFEHERVNAGLGDARLAAALADGDDSGRRGWRARGLRRRRGRRAG